MLLTLTSNHRSFIRVRGRGQKGSGSGDTVMIAQETAPTTNEEQGLPLPTADMSGDDLRRNLAAAGKGAEDARKVLFGQRAR